MTSFYADCTIRTAHGEAVGYVCGRDDENWSNYLDEMGLRSAMIAAIRAAPAARIGVFKSMDVEDASRGAGHGTAFVSDMMEAFEDNGAEIVILFADMVEDNPFSLVAWYEGWDLERVDRDRDAPCMMIASDALITQIREINGYAPGMDEADPAP